MLIPKNLFTVKTMKTYIHNLTFQDNSEFSQRFNYVSALWGWAHEEGISEEEADKRLQEHMEAKYCLEQGLPISYRNDIQT